MMLQKQAFFDTDTLNYRNSIYAIETAIENHFGNMLLGGDLTRIVYADNEYAFRARAKQKNIIEPDTKPIHNLDFPFMNYKIKSISNDTKRTIWSQDMIANGIYIPELQRSLRLNGIQVYFEATIFYQTNIDNQYAFNELMWDDTAETILRPVLDIDGQDVDNIAILSYDLEYEPTYDQNDWLEMNDIHSVAIDFNFQTFAIKDLNVYVPNEVIFNFLVKKDLDFTVDDMTESFNIYFSDEL